MDKSECRTCGAEVDKLYGTRRECWACYSAFEGV